MKKIALFLSLIVLFSSCEEIPPEIPDLRIEGDRVVLMEEFSGGKCTPCADAAIILEEQLAIHGHRLVVVTVHTYTPANSAPYPGAKHDFRTEKGQELLNSFGVPLGIPTGVINRKQLDSDEDLFLGKNNWAGFIGSELAIAPKANLNISLELDADSRTIELEATVVPAENIPGEVKLTALITESHIIDKQASPGGVTDDWEHGHILRDFITSIGGESLGADLAAGVPITKSYSYTIPPEENDLWRMENLEIVAHISEITSDTKEVLQAAAVGISE